MGSQEKIENAVGVSVRHHYLKIRSHRLHYITAGSGPPLLLIHGANIGWASWYPNIHTFSQYYTVYAVDLPGSGDSSNLEYRYSNLEKDFVDTIAIMIEKLALKKLRIVAHSFGGWIALRLALRKTPIHSMVLEAPLGLCTYVPWFYAALGSYSLAKILALTVMKPTQKNLGEFLSGVMSASSPLPPLLLEYYFENITQKHCLHPFLFLNRLFGFMRMRKELDLSKNLGDIRLPILLMFGDSDPLIPFYRVKQKIELSPLTSHEIFASTGHIPSLEKKEIFHAKALAFLGHSYNNYAKHS